MAKLGIVTILLMANLTGTMILTATWLRQRPAIGGQPQIPTSIQRILGANCSMRDLEAAVGFFQKREAWRRGYPQNKPYIVPSPGEISEAIWTVECLVYLTSR